MASVMGINNEILPVATVINEIVNYKKPYVMQNGIDLTPPLSKSVYLEK